MAEVTRGSSPEFSLRRLTIASVLLGFGLAWLLYRVNRAFGDFFADEGYLWYGVQRVLAGEIPLRDFMSYEVGRYYLVAGLLAPFGAKGLFALRAALGVFAGGSLALCIGITGYHWKESRLLRLLPVALLFAAWLVPRHKVFDIAISAVLVLALYRLCLRPAAGRYLQFGLAVGVAAVIGQNHGVYGLLASVLAFAWLRYVDRASVSPAWLACWAAGIVIGYLPVLLLAMFAPGFLHAEFSALHYLLFEYKGTNLPLPVPWPWRAWLHWSTIGWAQRVGSLGFVCVPAALVAALLWWWTRGRRLGRTGTALAAAAWAVAVPYANVAFSRADLSHLAQAMVPFLFLALAIIGSRRGAASWRWAMPFLLLLVCMPVSLALQPRLVALQAPVQQVEVLGDRFMVAPSTATLLHLAASMPDRGPVLAVPTYPGLDAALGERSPSWEIFPLFPRKPDFEHGEIARLQATPPSLVLVARGGVDGRQELAYPSTHPLTYGYVREHFVPVPSGVDGVDAFEAKAQAPGR